MQSTAALVNEIARLDSLWTTKDSVKSHIRNLEIEQHSDESIRRAILTQLSFMHKRLKCKGPSKEHFQLTHRQKPYTRSEMENHLQEVLVYNNLQPESEPHKLAQSQPKESSGFQYAFEEEQSISFDEQQRKMIIKIDEERKRDRPRVLSFIFKTDGQPRPTDLGQY